ncbi:MAG: hypothetical protein ABII02_01620 [Candidatus Magasanikbacteria bacterium]
MVNDSELIAVLQKALKERAPSYALDINFSNPKEGKSFRTILKSLPVNNGHDFILNDYVLTGIDAARKDDKYSDFFLYYTSTHRTPVHVRITFEESKDKPWLVLDQRTLTVRKATEEEKTNLMQREITAP